MGFIRDFFALDSPSLPRHRKGNADPVLTAEAQRLLRAIGQSRLADQIQVVWYARLRSTAGLAAYREHTVYLNPKLLSFAPVEPDHTLRHELAHLVAHARAGRRRIDPHGAEWRQACIDLGIPNERATHNLPLPQSRRARPYVYSCLSCGGIVHRTKPFRHYCACRACCRKFNSGRYDDRFRYQRVYENTVPTQS